jgi:hypothetical protein
MLYKLTTQDNKTRKETLWGEGVAHVAPGEGPLCTKGWLHAYTSPLLAVLMNPAHADINNPKLWEAEGDVGMSSGTKVGCTRLKTLREIPLPEISPATKVRFAILCGKAVYKDKTWNEWADRWLSGVDRTVNAAAADANAAYAARAAAAYATAAAAHAAYATAAAAYATAAAAHAARAARAGYAAANAANAADAAYANAAAYAAHDAANAAAHAADAAAAAAAAYANATAYAATHIDFAAFAEQAVREES